MSADRAAIISGRATYHTRVDAWQCDFNGHWNTSYFCFAFQAAADGLGLAEPPVRHLRFHRELRGGDPVEVRSFRLARPTPAVAHVLHSEGRLAATALDFGPDGDAALPPLPDTLIQRTVPRGIRANGSGWTTAEATHQVELGAADGPLRFGDLVPRLAVAAHHHAVSMGLTAAFTRETGIGRMLVEMRFERLGIASPGAFLRGASRHVASASRSYVSSHRIGTQNGDPLAQVDLCTLAVDMATRRATPLPGFLARPQLAEPHQPEEAPVTPPPDDTGSPAARLDAMSAELTRLQDHEAIRQAMYAYARGVDRADLALIAGAFHDDAEDDHGNFRGGKADVLAALKRSGENPAVTASQHHLGNILIDLRGDVADVETYFVAYQRRDEGGETFTRIRAGRYLDRFEKRDGRWRVARRKVIDDWSRLDQVVATAREVGPTNTQGTRDGSDASFAIAGFAKAHRT